MSALTSIRLLREIEAITNRRKTHQDKFENLIKFVNDDNSFLKDTGEKFSQVVGEWSPYVIEPQVGAFFNAQIQSQTPSFDHPLGSSRAVATNDHGAAAAGKSGKQSRS